MDPGGRGRRDPGIKILVIEMESKNMLELIVGIVVGLIAFSAILMPVIDDAESSTRTVSMNTTATYTMTDNLASLDLEKESGSTSIILNGETLENHTGIIISANNFDVRAQNDGQLFINDLANNKQIQVSSSGSLTMSIDNGEVEYTFQGSGSPTTYTLTLDGATFYVDDNGSWGGFFGNTSVNVTPGTEIYAIYFPIYFGSDYWSTYGIIKLEDGEVSETIVEPKYYSDSAWVDATDVVYDISAQYNSTNDYWNYTSAKITTSEYSVRMGEFIAPLAYKEISSSDANIIQIYDAIPILIIVGLIMGIVGAVFVRRLE